MYSRTLGLGGGQDRSIGSISSIERPTRLPRIHPIGLLSSFTSATISRMMISKATGISNQSRQTIRWRRDQYAKLHTNVSAPMLSRPTCVSNSLLNQVCEYPSDRCFMMTTLLKLVDQ